MPNTSANFHEELENLYRLHYITKKYRHIVEVNRDEWKLFEPSKFVYAYFTFNCFYNYNWKESVNNNELQMFEKKEEKGELRDWRDTEKYKELIKFVFSDITEDEKKDFTDSILGIKPGNLQQDNKEKKIRALEDALSKITTDSRITPSTKEDFIKSILQLLKEGNFSLSKLNNDIVYFIYLVRNNIFHGSKGTIEMSEAFQRKRLEIYSEILIAINQQLFNYLERRIGFHPSSSGYKFTSSN